MYPISENSICKDETKMKLVSLFTLLIFSLPISAQNCLNMELENSIFSFWGNISDLVISGNYAYVTTGYSGLQVLDISDPEVFQSVACWDDNPDRAWSVIIEGDYAYVGDVDCGISIIDISDPLELFEVGRLTQRIQYPKLTIAGDYLYVAGTYGVNSGMHIFDVSNPEEPYEVTYCQESRRVRNITILDNYAYASGYNPDDGSSYLHIYNVSDPTNPEHLNEIDYDGYERELIPFGDLAYLSVSNRDQNGFHILDISDRENPELVSIFDTGNGWAYDLVTSGDLLFLREDLPNQDEFVLFDISDLENPVEVNRMENMRGSGRISFHDNFVYARSDIELYTFDFSDLENPVPAGTFSRRGSTVYDVAVSGDLACAARFREDLVFLDISNPVEPELISSIEGSTFFNLIIDESRVFYNTHGSINVVDVSTPENPVNCGLYRSQGHEIPFWNIAVGDDVVLLCADYLRIIDISDLDNIRRASFIYDEIDTDPKGADIQGDYAYVVYSGRDDGGLQVIDITDIEDPVIVGQGNQDCSYLDVVVSGNYAYAYGRRSLDAFDISDPFMPVCVGQVHYEGLRYDYYKWHLELDGDFIYASAHLSGFLVFDISDPENPEIAGHYDTPGSTESVGVSGDIVYAADGNSLGIYRSTLLNTPDIHNNSPNEFGIPGSYPNPFNSRTTINYTLPINGNISLELYNPLGQRITSLYNGFRRAGDHSMTLDGVSMESGLYFVRLSAGNTTATQRIILIK